MASATVVAELWWLLAAELAELSVAFDANSRNRPSEWAAEAPAVVAAFFGCVATLLDNEDDDDDDDDNVVVAGTAICDDDEDNNICSDCRTSCAGSSIRSRL